MSTLTKREEFAKAALQGSTASDTDQQNALTPEAHADYAVQCADALIALLNKGSTERDFSLAEWDQLNDIRNAAIRLTSTRRDYGCARCEVDKSALDALDKALEARP
jgi:hypothetical protein